MKTTDAIEPAGALAATAQRQRPPRRNLAIYVLGDCPGCATAYDLAAALDAAGLALDVRLIDLGTPDAVRPPAVFAVPTYLLDGRVISLGNPDPAWLLARITAEAPADVDPEPRRLPPSSVP